MSAPQEPPDERAGSRLVARGLDRHRAAGRRLSWPWLVGLVVGLGAVVALVGWRALPRLTGNADRAPTLAAVELVAPLAGTADDAAARVSLRVEPARPGENAVLVRVANAAGTPVPAGAVGGVTLDFTRLDGPVGGSIGVAESYAAGGVRVVGDQLSDAGWWRVTAAVDRKGGTAAAPFYLLLPDPNVNGLDAVPRLPTDEAARAVFELGLRSTTGLRTVRFAQAIADGAGRVALSEQAVNAGGEGQAPAFTYRARGGLEAVVIGDRRWMRQPDGSWLEQPSAPMVPPSEWGEEYAGATGFRLGRVEAVDGERSQVVTFVVPERATPYRSPAWYAWWVGLESGQVRREAMVSRNHYMLNAFRAFDEPLPITPPAAGTALRPATTPAAPR